MLESPREKEHDQLSKAMEAFVAKGGKIQKIEFKQKAEATNKRVVFHDVILGMRQCDQVMSNHDLMDLQ